MILEKSRALIDEMPFLFVPLREAEFKEKDVIYLIVTVDPSGETRVLDAGQTTETGDPPINAPDRWACWLLHAPADAILVGMFRPPSDRNMKEDRRRMVDELRAKYRVPCGHPGL